MTKLTYAQQLAHPLWQRRRLEMLSAAAWSCSGCASTTETLHVHHRQYFKGRMAWEYADGELVVLCSDCHEQAHDLDEKLKAALCKVPATEVLALLTGFYGFEIVGEETYIALAARNAKIIEAAELASCAQGADFSVLSAIYALIVDADMERAQRARPAAEQGVM